MYLRMFLRFLGAMVVATSSILLVFSQAGRADTTTTTTIARPGGQAVFIVGPPTIQVANDPKQPLTVNSPHALSTQHPAVGSTLEDDFLNLLVLGVPPGLIVLYISSRRSRRQEQTVYASAVADAIKETHDGLPSKREQIEHGGVILGPAVDTSRWESFRPQLAAGLTDGKLAVRLTDFWRTATDLNRLADLHFQYNPGAYANYFFTPPGTPDAKREEFINQLREGITDACRTIERDALTLQAGLRTAFKLQGPARGRYRHLFPRHSATGVLVA